MDALLFQGRLRPGKRSASNGRRLYISFSSRASCLPENNEVYQLYMLYLSVRTVNVMFSELSYLAPSLKAPISMHFLGGFRRFMLQVLQQNIAANIVAANTAAVIQSAAVFFKLNRLFYNLMFRCFIIYN